MVSEKGIIVPVNPVGALFTEALSLRQKRFTSVAKGRPFFRTDPRRVARTDGGSMSAEFGGHDFPIW